MSGSQTFSYTFLDGTVTDTVNVTVRTPATNSTGYGLGYAVTAITGSIGGAAITAEVGTGGKEQTDSAGILYDNTIFLSGTSGSTAYGTAGSTNGLDVDGLEFTVGAATYNLFSSASTFYLNLVTANFTDHAVTLQGTNAPCYCPGTLITTDHGDVPVEALTPGDTVITASGQRRPIRWIGHRSHIGRFLAANPGVQPIRFHAGSLGDGLPRRDLRVSPEHAMFLDGIMIPARLLVNGSTITVERGVDRVDYYHVELDSHDVLLAEGAPSESYADDGDSGRFHNAADRRAVAEPVLLCAPRVESGFALEGSAGEAGGQGGAGCLTICRAGRSTGSRSYQAGSFDPPK